MDVIGSTLKDARETSGVSISEASKDLEIKDVIIENIEAGKIGAFKDVFELKKMIGDYAKYLGLNSSKIVDDFNEYLFEYTSKIPVKAMEKEVKEKIKEEEEEGEKLSPYTKPAPPKDEKMYYLAYIILLLLILIAVIWAVKQVTPGNKATTVIGYRR